MFVSFDHVFLVEREGVVAGSLSPHYRVSDQIASGNLPFHPLQVKLLTLEPPLPQHRSRGGDPGVHHSISGRNSPLFLADPGECEHYRRHE